MEAVQPHKKVQCTYSVNSFELHLNDSPYICFCARQ